MAVIPHPSADSRGPKILDRLRSAIRARQPKRLPNVLSREEVAATTCTSRWSEKGSTPTSSRTRVDGESSVRQIPSTTQRKLVSEHANTPRVIDPFQHANDLAAPSPIILDRVDLVAKINTNRSSNLTQFPHDYPTIASIAN